MNDFPIFSDRFSIHAFWEKLTKVSMISIQADRGRLAEGSVFIVKKSPQEMIFTERGKWICGDLQGMDFVKTHRWKADFSSQHISLEHLHYGEDRPVLLVHLAPVSFTCLQSVSAHQCGSDCYFGKIEMHKNSLHFFWRILGPKKDELLSHIYSFDSE